MNLSVNLMSWVHEISQSALAAAVAMLGLVILLELRSIARLRSLVDGHLARVFEQLDLLRHGTRCTPVARAQRASLRAHPPARIAIDSGARERPPAHMADAGHAARWVRVKRACWRP